MSGITLGEAVEAYLLHRTPRTSSSSMKNEAQVLRRFAATVRKRDIRVANLTPEHVEAWFVAHLQPHRDRSNIVREPIQASTWNNYYARVKGLTDYFARRGWTRQDLLAYVSPMRVTRKVRQQPSVDVLLAMLDSAREPRDRALLAVAMNTGLRANEVARLKVGDLDLDTLTLRVWISKSRAEDDMPVTSDLADEMRRWLPLYARAIGRPLQPDDHLLPTMSGPRYRWEGEGETRRRFQVEGTYVPDRPALKLHRVAQRALVAVGLPARHEGIHTIRRAVARAYYDSLKGQGHETAIRAAMVLLHHSNQSTTEGYLGLTAERVARDDSLRGKSFLTATHTDADVLPLASRRI